MDADQDKQWLIWLVAPLLIVLLPFLLAAVLLWLVIVLVIKLVIIIGVWFAWNPRGKDTLVVYSRSPYWQEYFEARLIPQIESRSLLLNWSDRACWPSWRLRTLAFRMFKGERDFNPMVLVFKPFHWPKSFRFYDSFIQHKHGREQPLIALEKQLAQCLGSDSLEKQR